MNFSTLSVAVSCPQPDSAIAKIAIESNLFISLSPLVKDEGILAGIVARENSASAGLENELGNCHGKAGYTNHGRS